MSALVLLLMAGCQSNAQQDLIAREMRRQEDQIYALEDYIQEYQQLVCKYRSENAALREQLGGECRDCEVTTPKVAPFPSPQNERRRTTPRPRSDTPSKPNTDTPPAPLDTPDIPALDETRTGIQPQSSSLISSRPATANPYEARQASHHESIAGDGKPESKSGGAQQLVSDAVLLRGEVVANASGGPRLAISVAAGDESWAPSAFDGSVTLMLVGIGDEGAKQNLGRWDYSASDAAQGVDRATGEPALQFHLELPAETPVDADNELWVRLTATSGGKMVSKAAVDLTQPGEFASRNGSGVNLEVARDKESENDQVPSSDVPAIAKAVHLEPASGSDIVKLSSSLSRVVDGEWMIARPGQPAILPDAIAVSESGWRASNDPVALAAETAKAKQRKAPPHRVARREKPSVKPIMPSWSADRDERQPSSASGAHASSTARPRWSQTR